MRYTGNMNQPLRGRSDEANSLNGVYPVPKTFDEVEEMNRDRSIQYENKKPRHLYANLSLRLYSLLIGGVVCILLIPLLIKFNIISGVFLSFLVVAMLVVYALWTINIVSSQLYKFGLSAWPFLISYIVFFLLLLSVSGWIMSRHHASTLYFVGTILHFATAYVLFKIMFKSKG